MTVRYTSDVSPGRWIKDRLHPFAAHDAGSVIPEGFEAYARVFHPALNDDNPVTWHEIAEANGRTVHPEMQFGNIAGTWSRRSPRPDLWTSAPREGTLTLGLARALIAVLRSHTTTPDRCWFAVWEGWGGLAPGTSRFEHPNRRYFLAEGAVEDAASSVFEPGPFQSASMWWPDDRAWFVSTEVDLAYTYMAGRRACIGEVLAHPGIEALRARPTDGITYASDALNPPVPLTP